MLSSKFNISYLRSILKSFQEMRLLPDSALWPISRRLHSALSLPAPPPSALSPAPAARNLPSAVSAPLPLLPALPPSAAPHPLRPRSAPLLSGKIPSRRRRRRSGVPPSGVPPVRRGLPSIPGAEEIGFESLRPSSADYPCQMFLQRDSFKRLFPSHFFRF